MIPFRDSAVRVVVVVWIVLTGAACATPAPSATPLPAATSFEAYALSFCAAFDALFRAVGNPDTGSASALTRSLDDAIKAHDVTSADRLVASITAELEAGRRHAASAGGWPPRAQMMANLDRVLVAFEVAIAAEGSAAHNDPEAAGSNSQAAFEQAGGAEAWFAMLEEAKTPVGETGQQCATVPVSP